MPVKDKIIHSFDCFIMLSRFPVVENTVNIEEWQDLDSASVL